MNVSVANFKSIDSAQFTIAPKEYPPDKRKKINIVYIGANNYQGKTSLFQALSAALTGEVTIYKGLSKKDVKAIIKDGESMAMVKISENKNSVSMLWPDCTLETAGKPISASPHACGLTSPVNYSKKELMNFFIDNFNAEPTRAELEKELKENELELGKEALDKLWQNIKELTWDGAHSVVVDKGRELKRKWEEITGEKYGKVKADGWIPEGMEPVLLKAKEEDLQKEVDNLAEWVEASDTDSVLTDDAKKRLEELAKNIPEARKTLKAVEKETAKIQEQIDSINTKISEQTVIAEQKAPIACPHCGGAVHYEKGKLIEAQDIDDKAVKKAEKELEKLRKELTEKTAELRTSEKTELNHSKLVDECVDAKEKLEALKGDEKEKAEKAEKLHAEYEEAERRLVTFQRKKNAENLHNTLLKNITLISILEPNGLRKTKLISVLKKFNKEIKELCTTAGWGVVHLDDDFNIKFSNKAGVGVPYQYCSESEQYRIRATFQVYTALRESPPFIMFDRVDLLDKEGKNSLIKLVFMKNIPTILMSTETERDDIKKMSKHGIRTYWLENGGLVGV